MGRCHGELLPPMGKAISLPTPARTTWTFKKAVTYPITSSNWVALVRPSGPAGTPAALFKEESFNGNILSCFQHRGGQRDGQPDHLEPRSSEGNSAPLQRSPDQHVR